MSRVSDAQCLAAWAQYEKNLIEVIHHQPNLIIVDNARPANDRVVWSGADTDLETATMRYQIEAMRPILKAALNVN